MKQISRKAKPASAKPKKGKTIYDKLDAAYSEMKKKNGPC